MLHSLQSNEYGVFITGIIGGILAITLIKLIARFSHKNPTDYAHEVKVFHLLFSQTYSKRDEAEHIYLLILSSAFTLGMLMLTCTSVVSFQIIKMNDSSAFLSMVLMFVATILCLYGVIKGIDSINVLMDVHLKSKDAAFDKMTDKVTGN